MLTRTADEWEEFLQANHVPACRVRTMGEALADPQLATRGIVHRHDGATGVEGGFGVPLAAFKFAHGGPRIDTPRPRSASTMTRFSPSWGTGRWRRSRGRASRAGGVFPPPLAGEG